MKILIPIIVIMMTLTHAFADSNNRPCEIEVDEVVAISACNNMTLENNAKEVAEDLKAEGIDAFSQYSCVTCLLNGRLSHLLAKAVRDGRYKTFTNFLVKAKLLPNGKEVLRTILNHRDSYGDDIFDYINYRLTGYDKDSDSYADLMKMKTRAEYFKNYAESD